MAVVGQTGGPNPTGWGPIPWLRWLVAIALVAGACSANTAGRAERGLPTPRPLPEPTVEPTAAAEPTPQSFPTTEPIETQPDTAVFDLVTDGELDLFGQPGGAGDAIGVIAGGSNELAVLGEPFLADDGRVWWLVRSGNLQGWVTPQLPIVGAARDVTDEVVSLLGPASYGSVDELALSVADVYASTDPPSERAVVSNIGVPPTITVDIVLSGDDSLAGVRVVVALSNTPNGTVTAADLESVTQRPLCARGITIDGLCT